MSAALPRALAALGHDVRVLLPAYRGLVGGAARANDTAIDAQWPWPGAHLRRLEGAGFELWLVDCPELFDRGGGPYLDEQGHDHADNPQRFGFLSHVAALLCRRDGPWANWPVDILHANDWQTALAPAYLSLQPGPRAASVFTIHNLAFQGDLDPSLAPALAMPSDWLDIEGVLHWGRLSMMKAALRHADAITTVSPTYAREIQTEALGFGLDGMLRLRADALHGILNGIDTDEWNPRLDASIDSPYTAGEWAAKARNKAALQRRVGLEVDPAAMLFGMVSRLAEQKGVDLVLANVGEVLALGAQLVVLGQGDPDLEGLLAGAAHANPGRIAARIGFEDDVAHFVEAGADAFLMPSRFEPCGLNQMYSLVYGTPPIVHATGGLADTVSDADALPNGTGFVMREPTADAMRDAMQRAHRAFVDAPRWHRIQTRGMASRFDWRASAIAYADVYARVHRARLDRHRR